MDLQLKIGITMFVILFLSIIFGVLFIKTNFTSRKVDERIENIILIQFGAYMGIHLIWGLIRLWTI